MKDGVSLQLVSSSLTIWTLARESCGTSTMTEPVTITLSAIGFFVKIVTTCGKVITIANTLVSFATDIQELLISLDVQHLVLENLIQNQSVLSDKLIHNPTNFEIVKRKLLKVQDHFKICEDLVKKYGAEELYAAGVISAPPQSETSSIQETEGTAESALSPVMQMAQKDQLPVPMDMTDSIDPSRSYTKKVLQDFKNWRGSRKKQDDERGPSHQNLESDRPKTTDSRLGSSAVGNIVSEFGLTRTTMTSQARSMNKHIIFKRVPWAMYDRQKLIDNIEKIRAANSELNKILKLLGPSRNSWELPRSTETDRSLAGLDHQRIAKSLLQLHRVLSKANTEGKQKFFMTLKLLEDHAFSNKDLHDHLAVADFQVEIDSDVFNLRRHFSNVFTDDGHLLIMECTRRGFLKTDCSSEIKALDKAPPENKCVQWNGVERWGQLQPVGLDRVSHVVYSQSDSMEVCPLTLAELLQDRQYRRKMLPVHTVQLSRLLLYTHLYLAELPLVNSGVRPDGLRYYLSDEEDDPWSGADALILSPWLATGLGSNPEAKLGARKGVKPTQEYILTKLGLLLCQLGVGVLFDYSRDIIALRNEALEKMEMLQSRMGLPFSEIVRRLLEDNFTSQSTTMRGDGTVSEVIRNSISTLSAIEVDMEGTISYSLLADAGYNEAASIAEGTITPREPLTQRLSETSVQGSATPSLQADAGSTIADSLPSVETTNPLINYTLPESSFEPLKAAVVRPTAAVKGKVKKATRG